MKKDLRVAFFPDSYLEVNGAAMTCRKLAEFAGRRELPFLCVHGGPKTEFTQEGSVSHLSLKRSPLSFSLDEDLAYDPLFQRHANRVARRVFEFKPDLIHITGLNDVSIIGTYLSWKFQLPMLGSWHTNIHEFAASRLRKMLRFLPEATAGNIAGFAERKIFDGAVLFYSMPRVILSPNLELVETLGTRTGKQSRLMGRGVDTTFFGPHKRTVNDDVFRFGFVGRLRAEKNVRVLVDIEQALLDAGRTGFEFLIVGEGTEREYLEQNMKTAVFTGFLEGEPLAEAYANMDVFIFPSETDAFGNVAQEANASGVPAIVSDKGGPKFILREGETGFVATCLEDYVKFALEMFDDREKLARMKTNSHENALARSWDSIFEGVYDAYQACVDTPPRNRSSRKSKSK